MNKICHLYMIKNSLNNKYYIGQTWQKIRDRFRGHKNNKGCPKLYNAIKKYGINNFIIEWIASARTQEDANYVEILLIQQYNSIKQGYNIHAGGGHGFLAEGTKNKLSIVNKGKNRGAKNGMFNKTGDKNPAFGKPGALLGRKGELHPMFGKRHSQETRRKMSEGHKGEKNHNFGKVCPKETREKISRTLTGRPLSAQTKEKLSRVLSGENAPCAKLTQLQAEQIRAEYEIIKSCAKLAKKYGVSKNLY